MSTSVSTSGVGIHTGMPCTVQITLTAVSLGIQFITPNGQIPALWSKIDPKSQRATDLSSGTARVQTVEHLMAALGFFDTGATIQVDGPEIPILDGSAKPWVSLLLKANAPLRIPKLFPVHRPINIAVGKSSASLIPLKDGEQATYTVLLDYPGNGMGSLSHVFCPTLDDFEHQLAPARTFALESEVSDILAAGLGRGGNLDCALIVSEHGPLNPGGYRFSNEPARHKMLDVLGDLSLLGGLPDAHIRLKRPGHGLTHCLMNEIMKTAPWPASESKEP